MILLASGVHLENKLLFTASCLLNGTPVNKPLNGEKLSRFMLVHKEL